jgi:RNase H-fold protein (predicted Holliday junction resolvase)
MALNRSQIERRKELTEKLNKGTLSPKEAGELKKLLELEKKEADKSGDAMAAMIIVLLMFALIAFLRGKGKK